MFSAALSTAFSFLGTKAPDCEPSDCQQDGLFRECKCHKPLIHDECVSRKSTVFDNGDVFMGGMLNGLPHGQGIFHKEKGKVSFIGTWDHGRLNGLVTMTYFPEGDIYTGMWNGHGDFEGEVEVRYGDGTYYRGGIKSGWREGEGTVVTNKGALLQGNFSNDLLNGQGTKYTLNGQVYKGEFEEGLSNGTGELVFPNGDFYKGEFVNDLRHGKGMYYFSRTGDVLEGEWRNNKVHGDGVVRLAKGGEFHGSFQDGYVGEGTLYSLFGETIYSNKWSSTMVPIGMITKTLPSGSVIEGRQDAGRWVGNVYYTCPPMERQLMKVNGFLETL